MKTIYKLASFLSMAFAVVGCSKSDVLESNGSAGTDNIVTREVSFYASPADINGDSKSTIQGTSNFTWEVDDKLKAWHSESDAVRPFDDFLYAADNSSTGSRKQFNGSMTIYSTNDMVRFLHAPDEMFLVPEIGDGEVAVTPQAPIHINSDNDLVIDLSNQVFDFDSPNDPGAIMLSYENYPTSTFDQDQDQVILDMMHLSTYTYAQLNFASETPVPHSFIVEEMTFSSLSNIIGTKAVIQSDLDVSRDIIEPIIDLEDPTKNEITVKCINSKLYTAESLKNEDIIIFFSMFPFAVPGSNVSNFDIKLKLRMQDGTETGSVRYAKVTKSIYDNYSHLTYLARANYYGLDCSGKGSTPALEFVDEDGGEEPEDPELDLLTQYVLSYVKDEMDRDVIQPGDLKSFYTFCDNNYEQSSNHLKTLYTSFTPTWDMTADDLCAMANFMIQKIDLTNVPNFFTSNSEDAGNNVLVEMPASMYGTVKYVNNTTTVEEITRTEGAEHLREIIIPTTITTISDAFRTCNNIEGFTVLWTDLKSNAGVSTADIAVPTLTLSASAFGIGIKNKVPLTSFVVNTEEDFALNVGANAFFNTNLKTLKLGNAKATVNGSGYNLKYITAGISAFRQTLLDDDAIAMIINKIAENVNKSNRVLNNNIFQECTLLTKVTIPAEITEIRQYAFQACNALETVIFDDNPELTTLGVGAFGQSTRTIESMDIPASVIKMDYYASDWSAGFTVGTKNQGTLKFNWTSVVDLPTLNPSAVTGNHVYLASANYLKESGTDYITVPANTQTIYENADSPWNLYQYQEEGTYYYTSAAQGQLASVLSGLETNGKIGVGNTYERFEYAGGADLSNADLLALGQAKFVEVDLSKSEITSIPAAMFLIDSDNSYDAGEYNDCLTKVYLPQSVYSIGASAFGGCYNLEELDWTPGVSDDSTNKPITIGSLAFFDARKLPAEFVGKVLSWEGYTKIESSTFRDVHTLTSITIPSHIKELGANCFGSINDAITNTAYTADTRLSSFAFEERTDGLKIGNSFINGRNSITKITFPAKSNLHGQALQYNHAVETIIFEGNAILEVTHAGTDEAETDTSKNSIMFISKFRSGGINPFTKEVYQTFEKNTDNGETEFHDDTKDINDTRYIIVQDETTMDKYTGDSYWNRYNFKVGSSSSKTITISATLDGLAK